MNVRLVVPEPQNPPPSVPSKTDDLDSGQLDVEKLARGHLDLRNRLRWGINPENN